MSRLQRSATRVRRKPEPAWEIAELLPSQAQWEEEDYIALDTNRLVEFSNGRLEVLPVPTMVHQLIVAYLHELLNAFVSRHDLGTVLFAAFRIRLWSGKYREPDVVFMRKEHAARISNEYWKGADLAMEVVSDDPEDRRRDLVTKRREYAKARIPEYWIVDPKTETIMVLRLSARRYVLHGKFGNGDTATSHSLPGFSVNVTEVFAHRAKGSAAGSAKKSRKQ